MVNLILAGLRPRRAFPLVKNQLASLIGKDPQFQPTVWRIEEIISLIQFLRWFWATLLNSKQRFLRMSTASFNFDIAWHSFFL
jgi:hypothetical protein